MRPPIAPAPTGKPPAPPAPPTGLNAQQAPAPSPQVQASSPHVQVSSPQVQASSPQVQLQVQQTMQAAEQRRRQEAFDSDKAAVAYRHPDAPLPWEVLGAVALLTVAGGGWTAGRIRRRTATAPATSSGAYDRDVRVTPPTSTNIAERARTPADVVNRSGIWLIRALSAPAVTLGDR